MMWLWILLVILDNQIISFIKICLMMFTANLPSLIRLLTVSNLYKKILILFYDC